VAIIVSAIAFLTIYAFTPILIKFLEKRNLVVKDVNKKDNVMIPRPGGISILIGIVASEITLSPIHKTGLDLIRKNSGFALRFPKFTGKIRYEKAVEDASTVEEVLTLYKRQSKINQEK